MREIRFTPTPDGWLTAAMGQLADGCRPSDLLWTESTADQPALPGLFDDAGNEPVREGRPRRAPSIPEEFRQLLHVVACHRDAVKWALLYCVLWRLTTTQPRLLAIEVDAEVGRLLTMRRQVQRDVYHMKAYVRFRKVSTESDDHYVAWHQPDHPVLPLAAPFFLERFAALRWSILTPDASAHWDGETVSFGPGVTQREAPTDDALETAWRTYYAATFNPARINPTAMQAQLPGRFWKSLPESRLIAPLTQAVRASVGQVMDLRQPMAELPMAASLPELAQAAATCTGSALGRHADRLWTRPLQCADHAGGRAAG